MALADYSKVDDDGQLDTEDSPANRAIAQSEFVFLGIFTLEWILKSAGMGFCGPNSYFADRWNWLDLFVVFTGWISVTPGLPSIAVVRTFRAIRPLKSVTAIPGLQALVISILNSLPALGGVLILLGFVFLLFGIGGLQIFGGPYMHTRCRLTPYPVINTWNSSVGYDSFPDYRCIPDPTFDVKSLNPNDYNFESSPWHEARLCHWPFEESDDRMCNLPDSNGYKTCFHDTNKIPVDEWRWCGSDYDAMGNERFQSSSAYRPANYFFAFNWGYTTFDNVIRSFITIFQSITMEGWSDIMYFTQDSVGVGGTLFFLVLILFGSFFVLNLILAILEENFNTAHTEIKGQKNHGMSYYFNEYVLRHFPLELPRYEWRDNLRKIVKTKSFDLVITALVIINTIILAMDHYPLIHPLYGQITDLINFLLMLCFTLEMILKVSGLGFSEYFQSVFNRFDFVIVFVSLITTIVAPPTLIFGGDPGEGGAISVLRSLKLFRVFKLVVKQKKMKVLISKVVKTANDMGYFGVLLFLFIYIFALMGMQLFANYMRYDAEGYVINDINSPAWVSAPERPRYNFDDFSLAFGTVFQIITTENWNEVMYDCWRSAGMVGIVFPLLVTCLGTFILRNLFLAILLHHFSGSKVGQYTYAEQKKLRKKEKREMRLRRKIESEDDSVSSLGSDSSSDEESGEESGDETGETGRFAPSIYDKVKFSKESTNIFPLNPMKTLGVFGPLNPVRVWCASLVANPNFSLFVMVLIAISTVTLMISNPLYDPNSDYESALNIIDITMTWLFTLECAIKIVAVGFLNQDAAYLRDGWNRLDFTIVVVSQIDLWTVSSEGLSGLKALRAFRALRPLRVISRAPGLKLVVNALLAAIPDVMNVAAVCMLVLIIFSIFTVSYFKGQLRHCGGPNEFISTPKYYDLLVHPVDWNEMTSEQQSWFGPSSPVPGAPTGSCATGAWPNGPCCPEFSVADQPSSRDICVCWGGSWDRVINQQFDNVGTAFVSLFEISTTEGWVSVMYAAVDARGIDAEPTRDNDMVWIYFFIFYIIVANFLAVNLFVGVVIDNFNKMKRKVEDGGLSMFLTPSQREWIKTQEIAQHLKPTKKLMRPSNYFLGICYDINLHPWFENIIMFLIVTNTIQMGIDFFGMPSKMVTALQVCNGLYALFFTIEAFIKICAERWLYFNSSWNRFDFFLTLMNDVGVVVFLATGNETGGFISIIRTFRVVRIVRATKRLKKANQLIETLLLTLPGLGNIVSLLFLLFIIFASIGMQFFATVAYHGQHNVHTNFRDFWRSLMTLLRFATGEDWGNFMYDMAKRQPGCTTEYVFDANQCTAYEEAGCTPLTGCGSDVIFPFLLLFTLLVGFVYLNLVIGFILDGFYGAEHRNEGIRPQDFPKFAIHWSEYDPEATCYIELEQLYDFVMTLYEPLGFGGNPLTEPSSVINRINSLHLTSTEDRVHFKDVLKALSAAALRRQELERQHTQDDDDEELGIVFDKINLGLEIRTMTTSASEKSAIGSMQLTEQNVDEALFAPPKSSMPRLIRTESKLSNGNISKENSAESSSSRHKGFDLASEQDVTSSPKEWRISPSTEQSVDSNSVVAFSAIEDGGRDGGTSSQLSAEVDSRAPKAANQNNMTEKRHAEAGAKNESDVTSSATVGIAEEENTESLQADDQGGDQVQAIAPGGNTIED
jgi:hypothetical protein